MELLRKTRGKKVLKELSLASCHLIPFPFSSGEFHKDLNCFSIPSFGFFCMQSCVETGRKRPCFLWFTKRKNQEEDFKNSYSYLLNLLFFSSLQNVLILKYGNQQYFTFIIFCSSKESKHFRMCHVWFAQVETCQPLASPDDGSLVSALALSLRWWFFLIKAFLLAVGTCDGCFRGNLRGVELLKPSFLLCREFSSTWSVDQLFSA